MRIKDEEQKKKSPEEFRILVADDLESMRSILVKMLGDIGFTNVVDVADGEEAWQLLLNGLEKGGEEEFDLVISDINMPELNGMKFLERVRRSNKFSWTFPFVIVSIEDLSYTMMKAVDLGATNYIIKPYSPNDLKKKIFDIYENKK